MKTLAAPTQRVLSVLAVALVFVLTGCTADSLTGPDLSPTLEADVEVAAPATSPDVLFGGGLGEHNEGISGGGLGEHNEGISGGGLGEHNEGKADGGGLGEHNEGQSYGGRVFSGSLGEHNEAAASKDCGGGLGEHNEGDC